MAKNTSQVVYLNNKLDQKKKGINGRQKGHGFESRVAKILATWSGKEWKRVPLSGGWDKSIITGDVFLVEEYERKKNRIDCPNVCFPLSVECKNDESWDLSQLFKEETKAPIKLWWKQASEDAVKSKKQPALIFTKNYFPIFIMIKLSVLTQLTTLSSRTWRELPYFIYPTAKTELVVFLLFDDFLSWIDYPTLLKLSDKN